MNRAIFWWFLLYLIICIIINKYYTKKKINNKYRNKNIIILFDSEHEIISYSKNFDSLLIASYSGFSVYERTTSWNSGYCEVVYED